MPKRVFLNPPQPVCSPKGCPVILPGKCVHYTGNPTSCLGILTNTNLDEVIKLIDQAICDTTSHVHGIGNSLGIRQFTFSTNEDVLFEGTGGTTVSFDPISKKVIIDSGIIGEEFTLGTQDTTTVDLEGAGTVLNPLTANVFISQASNNAILVNGDGLYVPQTIEAGIVYGGIVTWISGYTYHISAAGYYINGVFYTSPEATITLSPADSTFNRIDTFIVDTSGVASVLEGIPSDNPAQAPLDPATQLELSFAVVEAGTTEPTDPGIQCLYKENVEWTTTSNSSRIVVNSTSNPCNDTMSIEGTNVITGNEVQLLHPGGQFSPLTNYTVLTFRLRPKSGWTAGNSRRLTLFWKEDNVVIHGALVVIRNGTYGFNSSLTSSCQYITIPLTDFALATSSMVDRLMIAVDGNGFGFHIDNICLQSAVLPPPPVFTDVDEKVKVSSNDTTAGYLNGKLVSGTGITLTELNNGSNESLRISHSDTSSVSDIDTIGAQVIDTITFDTFGHTQTVTTRTLTLADLGYTPPVFDDNYVDSVTFNTTDGILTLGRTGVLPDLTVDLDGRYLQTETDAIALAKTITLNTGAGISITGTATQALTSNPVWSIAHADTSSIANLDTAGAQVIDTVTFDTYGHVQTITTRNLTLDDLGYTPPVFEDNYVDSVSFNPANGVLTLGRNNALPDLTVNIDGRYLTSFAFQDGNGFDGTVTNSTSTPTLSLITTVLDTHVMYSNAGGIVGSPNFTFNGTQVEVTGNIYTHKVSTNVVSGVTTGLYYNTVNWTSNISQSAGSVYASNFNILDYSIGTSINFSAAANHTALLSLVRLGGTATVTGTVNQNGVNGKRAISSNAVFVQLNTNSTGITPTFDHVAGMQIYGPQATNGSGASASNLGFITNYYGILIGDSTEYTNASSRITNRWGIYQWGATDKNYFGAEITANTVPTYSTGGYNVVVWNSTTKRLENVTPGSISGGPFESPLTFNNGLTRTADIVQLGSSTPTGSPFTSTRNIFTDTYSLNILGLVSGSTVSIQNQNATSGVGLDVSSDNGIGATIGTANGQYALHAYVLPTSTDTIHSVLKILRAVAGGTALDGIGNSIDIFNQHSSGQSDISNQIISKWTTASTATRVSQFEIWGVDSTILSRKLAIAGSGQLILDAYTSSSAFTGTAVANLAVDASGNVITVAAGGGGTADGNNFPSNLTFDSLTGILTLARTGLSDLTVDLDGRWLITETDPIFSASVAAGIVAGDITNWDSAYGWGDHALAGYLTQTIADTLYAPIGHTHTFFSITSKPTTLAGYGITDAYTITQLQTSGQSSVHWDNITNKPTIPTQYTDELAQDAVGNALLDTDSIDFSYDDTNNQIRADIKPTHIFDLVKIKEIRFRVGDVGAPVAATGTTFVLEDCSGNPVLNKKIKFYRERFLQYVDDDYTYDPVTGTITVTVAFNDNERLVFEAYSTSMWDECDLTSGGGGGTGNSLMINTTDAFLINGTDKLVL